MKVRTVAVLSALVLASILMMLKQESHRTSGRSMDVDLLLRVSSLSASNVQKAPRKLPKVSSVAQHKERILGRESRLNAALGEDDVGKKLQNIFDVFNRKNSLADSAFERELLHCLGTDLIATQLLLKDGLERLPVNSEFSGERIALLQLMGSMSGDDALVKSQALREIVRNVPPARPDLESATSPEERARALETAMEHVLPTVAFEIFVEKSEDAEEAFKGAIAGIEMQNDTGIRNNMAANLLSNYPELAGRLVEAAKARNIVLRID